MFTTLKLRTQLHSVAYIFIIRLVTTHKTSNWLKWISNLVLLWHVINCSTIANICFWNITHSISTCAWCCYCINWCSDLACAFFIFCAHLNGHFSLQATKLINIIHIGLRKYLHKCVRECKESMLTPQFNWGNNTTKNLF